MCDIYPSSFLIPEVEYALLQGFPATRLLYFHEIWCQNLGKHPIQRRTSLLKVATNMPSDNSNLTVEDCTVKNLPPLLYYVDNSKDAKTKDGYISAPNSSSSWLDSSSGNTPAEEFRMAVRRHPHKTPFLSIYRNKIMASTTADAQGGTVVAIDTEKLGEGTTIVDPPMEWRREKRQSELFVVDRFPSSALVEGDQKDPGADGSDSDLSEEIPARKG
jgi:hypothetical protein